MPEVTYDQVVARAREINATRVGQRPPGKTLEEYRRDQVKEARENLHPDRLFARLTTCCEGRDNVLLLLAKAESDERAQEIVEELIENGVKLPKEMVLEVGGDGFVYLRICL